MSWIGWFLVLKNFFLVIKIGIEKLLYYSVYIEMGFVYSFGVVWILLVDVMFGCEMFGCGIVF